MPEIKLTNNANLTIDASVEDKNASLNRYLKDAMAFRLPPEFDSLGTGKPLKDVAGFESAALNAGGSGSFAVGGTTLGVHPGASASLALLKDDGRSDFVNSLKLAPDFAPNGLVSFAVKGSLSLNDSASVSDFCFGISGGQSVALTSFYSAAADDTVGLAIHNAVAGLTIPRDLADLTSLPVGSACRLDAQSSLKFSASVSYSLLNDALASVAIEKISALSIQANASVSIGASAAHTAGHTLTIARISDRMLHIAVSLADSNDLAISLTASAGLTADLGPKDALAFLLDKFGLDAGKEMTQIKQELPDKAQELSEDIKGAIEGALSDSLQVSLKAAVDRTDSRKSLFVYAIDMQGLDESSRPALQAALSGDFTAMTMPGAQLAGIQVLDSSLTEASKDTHSLGIHLLGILNFESTSRFIETAKVNLTTGKRDIVLSDQTIEVATDSLADDKLRQIVLKDATLTLPAVANGGSSGGSLNLMFFDHEGSIIRSKLQQFVNTLRAIGSADAAAAVSALGSGIKGSGALYAGLNLSADQCRRLFIADGKALGADFYLEQMRSAQATILSGDDDSALRLKLFGNNDDAFWRALAEAGSAANITQVLNEAGFGSESEFLVTDVMAAVWWSSAMAAYADALQQGKSLVHAGSQVVKDSGLGFNEPWFILACWKILGNPAIESRFTAPGLAKVMTAGGSGTSGP